ncbi:putative Mg/Co/Ni transporter MgtE (contains CBS domain) [Methanocella conradii HZ254]|uniref:Mg/Co/Ni transporter MgtE (Contains CBS domain) n=1 Tax=Methanocella conradii (strain DSM 24694 / JCM 17849 / CGMCC 1.5162 / HZ254) TaxID=1041930 RepID=H8I9K4_METCZ|nr:CBS domain-containing protein [Methanocella conradii]AFD00049.1 putative Mg/Co/Ni transporter MgtE (contains CBS domain) [Methanocella conradii HZ254]
MMSESKGMKNDGTRPELAELLQSGRATFFSQFIGKRVVDKNGRILGKMKDFAIRPGEALLEVSAIVYGEGLLSEILGHDVIVGMANVSSIDKDIKLKVAMEDIPPGRLSDNEMLIRETILDKQIVDIDDLKVVRVNDVLMAWIKNSLCLVGVDVGFNGIMRRIGLMWIPERLNVLRLPEHIISWSYIEPLDPALRKVQLKIPRKNVNDLHPADIADIIEELDNKGRFTILKSLDKETAAETLEMVEPEVRSNMLQQMSAKDVASLMDRMNPDDAADILITMPKERASEILKQLCDISKGHASDIRDLMKYRENSAGGMMNTEFIYVHPDQKVSDAFAKLRALGSEIDMIYYIYVLDEKEHLVGVFSLRDLLLADPAKKVKDIMQVEVVSVLPTSSREEVANVLSRYDLLAVPVVNNENVMLGIVTFDDALEYTLPEDIKSRLPANYHRIRRAHKV